MQVLKIEFNKTPLVEKVFNKIIEKYDTHQKLEDFTKKLASEFYREYVKAIGDDLNLLQLEDPFTNNPGFDSSHEGWKHFLFALLASMADERLQNLLKELEE